MAWARAWASTRPLRHRRLLWVGGALRSSRRLWLWPARRPRGVWMVAAGQVAAGHVAAGGRTRVVRVVRGRVWRAVVLLRLFLLRTAWCRSRWG
eukprot:1252373-Rhodomonas_salina.1